MNHPEDQDQPDDLPGPEEWSRLVGSQRNDQYTPMGEIAMMGDFASGVARARRVGGWRRWVGWVLTVMIIVCLVTGALTLF